MLDAKKIQRARELYDELRTVYPKSEKNSKYNIAISSFKNLVKLWMKAKNSNVDKSTNNDFNNYFVEFSSLATKLIDKYGKFTSKERALKKYGKIIQKHKEFVSNYDNNKGERKFVEKYEVAINEIINAVDKIKKEKIDKVNNNEMNIDIKSYNNALKSIKGKVPERKQVKKKDNQVKQTPLPKRRSSIPNIKLPNSYVPKTHSEEASSNKNKYILHVKICSPSI